jgi:uncharacterized protein YkwD
MEETGARITGETMARFSIVLVVALAPAVYGGGEQGKVTLTKEEQRLVDLTNEARKKEGLSTLKVNPVLVGVARKHAEAMAKARKLEHVLDGVGPPDRIKEAGYKFLAYGENIQFSKRKGGEAADFAMKQWLESKPHRENLFNEKFTEIGIGMARNDAGETYFTQVLATPRK